MLIQQRFHQIVRIMVPCTIVQIVGIKHTHKKEVCHDSINLSVKVCRNCGIISLMIGHIVYRYAFLKDGIFTIDDGDRIDMMDLLDRKLEDTFSHMIEKYLEDSLETIQYMGDIDEW